MKYYVISKGDINEPDYEIAIRTWPTKTNSSHEEITNGWAGTHNDISTDAHGVYDTLDDAIKHIMETWSDVEEIDYDDDAKYYWHKVTADYDHIDPIKVYSGT